MSGGPAAWSPPAYPYDRLGPARAMAAALPGGIVDMSIGTPGDPPPASVLEALADADRDGAARGYPASAGSGELRAAISAWLDATFSAQVSADAIGACVGTKELVASLPHHLHLRDPRRDTVLYPAVSYPTYEMGASLARLRAVAVPSATSGRMDLAAVSDSDAERALVLWVDSPANPTGVVEDLAAIAAWALERGILVASDECYAEMTWEGPPSTVLGHGAGADGQRGVLAVHSLSKRSNLAGLRVGWYSGDPEVVGYLREVRKHAGLMVPGPAQLAAVAALSDAGHVAEQRARYRRRLSSLRELLAGLGSDAELPAGGFYLWAPSPGGDDWAWVEALAATGGLLASPGELYGPAGAGHVRFAVVVPDERIELAADRLGARRGDRLGARREDRLGARR